MDKRIGFEGEAARQPEGEVVRHIKFFQPTQRTPNPIRDRLRRLDNMKDGRNTSRSQEINVSSFNEELSSSDSTWWPTEMEVNQTGSSEDSKSLNVEQNHDRSGRPGEDTVAVQGDPEVYHQVETLNVGVEVLRKGMENPFLFMTIIMNWWWWRRQIWTSKFQDFHIPLWNTRKVPAFDTWFRKREPPKSTCSSTRATTESISFNPVQNQRKLIQEVGTIELCELLETEPKTQCTVCLSCWSTGIGYCMCRRFLRKGREAKSAIHQVYDGPFNSGVRHQEGKTMDIDL